PSSRGDDPMEIQLIPTQEAFVKELVDGGKFVSADEVIQHALFLLMDEYKLYKAKLEELRKEIAVGIEQADRGEVAPLDMEAIKAAARERLALERTNAHAPSPSV